MAATQAGFPVTPFYPPGLPADQSLSTELNQYATNASQQHALGRRLITYDGSVFRYSKAGAAITSTQLAVHTEETGAGVSYETIAAAASIGDTVLSITEASITKDDYAGGYVVIFETGSSGGFVRRILSNTASDDNDGVKLTLDQPLHVALTTADAYELYPNPYDSMSQANASGAIPFAGMPPVTVSDTYYFWTQTWGPVFIAPQSGVGAAYVMTGYFRHDGSIDVRSNIGTYVLDQIAGHIIIGSASGDGPLFMLTVSI